MARLLLKTLGRTNSAHGIHPFSLRLDPIDPLQAVGYKGVRNQMRKRLKKKRRSCALCKPHKMAKAGRWKAAELDRLASDEKEMKRAVRATS
jgi:hypothetical protein